MLGTKKMKACLRESFELKLGKRNFTKHFFLQFEYLYFKGHEVKYGSKIILLLRDLDKYSSTHKLYYDEYHIYLYSANAYSPDIRDVEVYEY